MVIYFVTFQLFSIEIIQHKSMHLTLFKNKLVLYSSIFLIVLSSGIQPTLAQQNNIDSLISVLQTTKVDTNRVNILYKLANIFTDTKPDKAIIYANQGLSLSQKTTFKKGQSICLNALGLAYYQIGKLDTALICFEKRFDIVTNIKDSKGLAEVYDNLAIIYIRYGNNQKALELRRKANDIYVQLNEINKLASGYNWIGSIYKEQGEYSIALEYYLKALKISESEHDERNIGYILINISSIYRYLKQYEKAINYALASKSKFINIKNSEGIGGSLYRLALIYLEKKDYDNTISYLNEAKIIFEGTQNKYFQTLVNLLLGTTYQDKGNNDMAISYFDKALPIAIQMGDKNVVSVLFQNIGSVYQDKGEYLKALEYMHKSEILLKEINDKKSLLDISPTFIELYSRINQLDSVVKYLKIYQQLSDTIFNEQNSKSIAEMQTKYETEKKDKEIITLNLEDQTKKNNILLLQNINQVTSLKLQNSAIENEKHTQSFILAKAEQEKQLAKIEIYKLNEEKQTLAIKDEKDNKRLITLSFILGLGILSIISLLSFLNFRNKKKKEKAILNQKAAELGRQIIEIDMKALRSQMNPHFIFNCVDSIERLLDDAKIKESKISLSNFSNLTRTVLENSMKREISLEEEIETLKIYMDLENIRFKNTFTQSIIIHPGIDTKITLIPPLILQPFVENSIKHGFRNPEKSGHLKIEVRVENEFLICIVEDNGIGRSQGMNIKPVSGFKKESIGMKITGARLQLISEIKSSKSYFEIEDLVDTFNNPMGTRVKMFLPYELAV